MKAAPIALAVAGTETPERAAPGPATPDPEGGSVAQRAIVATDALRAKVATLLPYVEFGAQRLGRSGIVGLALLVFSIGFALSTNLPLRAERQTLREQAHVDEATVGRGRTTVKPPAVQLDGFVRSLPRQSDLPRVTAQLFEQARVAGIELERGTYELLPARSGRFARYRITYPVKGTYPQVRSFVDGALLAAPAVALESLRFERPSIADDRIAADLRFVVLLRNDG